MTTSPTPTDAMVEARTEIIRIVREEYDPTPPSWSSGDWHDNAEEVADKILAALQHQEPGGTTIPDGLTSPENRLEWLLGVDDETREEIVKTIAEIIRSEAPDDRR